MAESGGVTVAMLGCIGTAIGRARAEMDAMVDEHRPQLTPAETSAVEAAQRDWHVYGESTCDIQVTLWGDGNFATVLHTDCWLELTWERLNWL